MREIRLDQAKSILAGGSVLTSGTFDGLHRGHLNILQEVEKISESAALSPVMLTFDPHPRSIVTGTDGPKLLTTTSEKKRLAGQLFSGYLLVLPFTGEIRELGAEQFVEQIVSAQLGVRQWVVGFDHVLGKNRSGTIDRLRELGERFNYRLHVIPALTEDGHPISSSRIREAIAAGKMEMATGLLGHPYPMDGIVERGMGMGRKLGYPTANLSIPANKLLPGDGIYACRAEMDGRFFSGMLYVGRNWLAPDAHTTIEVNLFDFDQEIYGKEITVYPVSKTRDSMRIESADALMARLAEDREDVLNRLTEGDAYGRD